MKVFRVLGEITLWALLIAAFVGGYTFIRDVARRGVCEQPTIQQVQPFNKRSA